MKITIGHQAATCAVPDYDLLRAALVAAQAATPTARASAGLPTVPDAHAALHGLFARADAAEVAPGAGPAGLLGHRFGPVSRREDAA